MGFVVKSFHVICNNVQLIGATASALLCTHSEISRRILRDSEAVGILLPQFAGS
jgi:hypothetical protein